MRRLPALALLAALSLAVPACAAEKPVATPFQTGKLTIAGEAFAPSDVLDARALPDINGKVGVLLTLAPKAAKRLEEISLPLAGRPLLVALDGKTLANELVRKPIADGVIEIPGRWNLSDGEAIARRISGRDPLPDDLGGE